MTTGTLTDKIPIPETPTASNHDVALFVAFKDQIKTELEDTGLLPAGELICELSDGKIYFKSSSERPVEELLEIVRKNTNIKNLFNGCFLVNNTVVVFNFVAFIKHIIITHSRFNFIYITFCVCYKVTVKVILISRTRTQCRNYKS